KIALAEVGIAASVVGAGIEWAKLNRQIVIFDSSVKITSLAESISPRQADSSAIRIEGERLGERLDSSGDVAPTERFVAQAYPVGERLDFRLDRLAQVQSLHQVFESVHEHLPLH